LNFEL